MLNGGAGDAMSEEPEQAMPLIEFTGETEEDFRVCIQDTGAFIESTQTLISDFLLHYDELDDDLMLTSRSDLEAVLLTLMTDITDDEGQRRIELTETDLIALFTAYGYGSMYPSEMPRITALEQSIIDANKKLVWDWETKADSYREGLGRNKSEPAR